MKLATTTGDFMGFCATDIERIQHVSGAGFKYIDLKMKAMSPSDLYMQDDWKNTISKLKDEAERLGVTFVQAHSPAGNPIKGDSERIDNVINGMIRSVEICGELGIKNTVVHLGSLPGISKDEWIEKNLAFCKRLFPVMEKCGVNVLIENSTAVNMRDMYYCNTAKAMLEFLEYADHPLLHACWDTGHANCEGHQYDEILTLGKELYAIHYNDNRANADQHFLPYLGTLNHDEVINALIDIDYKGYFTFESSDSFVSAKGRRPFLRDERLLKPQLFMQDKFISLLYDMGKYMLSEYGIFEE